MRVCVWLFVVEYGVEYRAQVQHSQHNMVVTHLLFMVYG